MEAAPDVNRFGWLTVDTFFFFLNVLVSFTHLETLTRIQPQLSGLERKTSNVRARYSSLLTPSTVTHVTLGNGLPPPERHAEISARIHQKDLNRVFFNCFSDPAVVA